MSFEEFDEGEVAENLRLQLRSTIMVSQRAAAHLREEGGGHLVHVGSIQSISGLKFEHYEGTDMTFLVKYTAVKYGVVGLTKYLAKYLSGTGIRVNYISPGGIENGQLE